MAAERRTNDPPEPLSGEALWGSLACEPNTGVTLMTPDGGIDYLNAQAAAIYFGEGTDPATIVGRTIDDLYSPAFCTERRAILGRVAETGKPLLFRTIWRGQQHHAWIYPVPGDADGDGRLDHLLVVTRRTAVGPDDPPLQPGGCEVVRAEVNDLGELGVLSPRELVVLALLGSGLTLRETAKKLHRSVKTIESQRDAIGRKLGVHSRSQLLRVVLRAGLTLEDAEAFGR